MVVDAGEPQIFVRPGAERFEHTAVRGMGIEIAAGDLVEQELELGGVHRGNRRRMAAVLLTTSGPVSNISDCAVGGFDACFD